MNYHKHPQSLPCILLPLPPLSHALCVRRAVLLVVLGASSRIVATCPAALMPVSRLSNSFTCAYAFVWANLQRSCILSYFSVLQNFSAHSSSGDALYTPESAPCAYTRGKNSADARKREPCPAPTDRTAPHRTAPPFPPAGNRTSLTSLSVKVQCSRSYAPYSRSDF